MPPAPPHARTRRRPPCHCPNRVRTTQPRRRWLSFPSNGRPWVTPHAAMIVAGAKPQRKAIWQPIQKRVHLEGIRPDEKRRMIRLINLRPEADRTDRTLAKDDAKPSRGGSCPTDGRRGRVST